MSNDPTKELASVEEIAAREALICGRPPRIPPLEGPEVAAEAMALRNRLHMGMFGKVVPISVAEIPPIFMTLHGISSLFEKTCMVSLKLYRDGTLRPRDRELIVLRATWLCQAPFAWGEHVRQAKNAGITSEEIERVTIGSRAPEWSEYERALMLAAEELRSDATITDSTWKTLANSLNERQLFEITVLVGQFTLVAYYQNALRLRLAPSNLGLQSR